MDGFGARKLEIIDGVDDVIVERSRQPVRLRGAQIAEFREHGIDVGVLGECGVQEPTESEAQGLSADTTEDDHRRAEGGDR